jgi:hypothetical protein
VRSVTSLQVEWPRLRLRRALLDGECSKSDRHVLSCNGLIATHSGAIGTPGKLVVPLFAVLAATDSNLLRLPCGADCAGMDSEYITEELYAPNPNKTSAEPILVRAYVLHTAA